MRPGDVITVNPLDRKVTVFGEVKRPGSYELLPGENTWELINIYANGYTARADGRVGIRRYEEGDLGMGTIQYLTQEELSATNYPLQNFDEIYVLSK